MLRRRARVADPERPLPLADLSPGLASFARQTRTLALELRRRSEEARHWPDDAGELEQVRVRWWAALSTETIDFTPLVDDPRSCVEAQVLQADARAEVRRAVSSLPETLEAALSLHLSGLSCAEIAERLGISERNVSVRLTRARHRLRGQLAAA